MTIDHLPKNAIPAINRVTIFNQQQCCFAGWYINAKALNYFFNVIIT